MVSKKAVAGYLILAGLAYGTFYLITRAKAYSRPPGPVPPGGTVYFGPWGLQSVLASIPPGDAVSGIPGVPSPVIMTIDGWQYEAVWVPPTPTVPIAQIAGVIAVGLG